MVSSSAEYPVGQLAREPAPPYAGEGGFAVWHYSRLPAASFRPHEVGGYWVSQEPADAVDRVVIDDLIGWHARAGIELRITPSIWPFWLHVTNSTVEFSGCRLRNAAPHPDRVG